MSEKNKKTIHKLELIIDFIIYTIKPAIFILILIGLYGIFIRKPLIGLILSIILVSVYFWTPMRYLKIVFMLSIPVLIFLVIFALQSLQPTTIYENLEKPVICNQYNKNDFIKNAEGIAEGPMDINTYSIMVQESRMHWDDPSMPNNYCE